MSTRTAVLDPDDHRGVDRLRDLMLDAIREANPGVWTFDEPMFTDALTAALYRYTEPTTVPKPDEPLEVGSVVTDTAGHVWARTSWDMWQCLSEAVEPATWDQLDVAPEQP